jgi:hypothetical protein
VAAASPQPDPETVSALLDTTWRVADIEVQRTDTLDRKAATVATFASVVAALTAALGGQFLERVSEWWALGIFVGGLLFLTASVVSAVWDRGDLLVTDDPKQAEPDPSPEPEPTPEDPAPAQGESPYVIQPLDFVLKNRESIDLETRDDD